MKAFESIQVGINVMIITRYFMIEELIVYNIKQNQKDRPSSSCVFGKQLFRIQIIHDFLHCEELARVQQRDDDLPILHILHFIANDMPMRCCEDPLLPDDLSKIKKFLFHVASAYFRHSSAHSKLDSLARSEVYCLIYEQLLY